MSAMETAQSVRDTFDLGGRVAIVTGAGSGLGRASAEVLAGSGATVYCADVRGRPQEASAAAITAAAARRSVAV